MLGCIAIGMVIGAAAELSARRLGLWIYRQPQYPIMNVIVMFGIIMGSVAGLVPHLGRPMTFAIAFAIGVVYEIANLRMLNWWYFPGQRLAVVHGHAAIVVVLSILWGAVPLMTAALHAALF